MAAGGSAAFSTSARPSLVPTTITSARVGSKTPSLAPASARSLKEVRHCPGSQRPPVSPKAIEPSVSPDARPGSHLVFASSSSDQATARPARTWPRYGPGAPAYPSASQDDRLVDHLESQPARLRRQENPARAELHESLPEISVESVFRVERGSSRARVAPLDSEAADRLEQLLLLLGEEEAHFASSRRSRGSPRPRSAMTLRWMFEVPPAMATPSDPMVW